MQSEFFTRGVNVAGVPVLGSDVDPRTISGAEALEYVALDNALTLHFERDAVPSGVEVAFTYRGGGSPATIVVTVLVWSASLAEWRAGPGTIELSIAVGELVSVPVPIGSPRGVTVALLVTAPLGVTLPDGRYNVHVAPSYSAAAAAAAGGTVAQGAPGATPWPTIDQAAGLVLAAILGRLPEIGQQARAASLSTTLATEDMAALSPLYTLGGSGQKAASTSPAPVISTPTVYQGGVVFTNADPSNAIYLGLSGVGASGANGGYWLSPNGGSISLGPVDISTIYLISAAGTPLLTWLGLGVSS